MRTRWIIAAVLSLVLSATAQTARKSCEDLKAEIAKKLDDKGVKSYTLDIVEKDKATDGKVVGTCDGGAKQIVYNRTAAPKTAAKPETSKPKP
jgi:uncharacterized protein DUF1161